MARKLIYGVCAVLLALVFTTCDPLVVDDGYDTRETELSMLAGVWDRKNTSPPVPAFEITSDGKFIMEGTLYDISVSNGGATIKFGGTVLGTFTYGVSDNEIVMIDGTGIGTNIAALSPVVKRYTQQNPFPLTENVWADGNLPAYNNYWDIDYQWFTFTATASTQYIHAEFGTLKNLYVQFYNSGGAEAESGYRKDLDSTYRSTSRSLIAGQTYYIRLRPYEYSSSGTYRIMFNTSSTAPIDLPSNPIQLTENQWKNGDLSTSADVQWFTFTATAATQYIHADFGTLTDLYVQVYDSAGVTSGSQTNLYGSTANTSRALTAGQTYYIRVRPYGSSNSGTYRIAFNASSTAPPVQLPSNAISLTANQWVEGNIPTSGGEQWFTFTATASTQYIHASFGTLTNLSVRVYDSGGTAVGSETWLNSYIPSTSRTLTAGQTYYIRVWRSNNNSGTYRIAFNTSTTMPFPLPDAIPLTENVWSDGNLPASNSAQWFTFTATASTQYIHVEPGTLTSLSYQLYDSGGAATYSSSLTTEQTYYIRVWPYSSSSFTGRGTYRIAFNTSSSSTAILTQLPSSAIPLTANQWADGNIPTSSDVQWFTFTATAETQYFHFEPVALTSLYYQVYDSGGAATSSSSLTTEQTYYIRVWPNSNSYSGTYRIAFNTTVYPPGTTFIPLTENQWADGNIPASGTREQWFTFTATADAQWIHFEYGTLTRLSYRLYDSAGAAASRSSLTTGQTYYIRVRPDYSSDSGTYRIAFNATPYPPDTTLIPLTENTWADGSLPTGSSQQWFTFTATASEQYIHVSFGTLTALFVNVYDSGGTTVGGETYLSGSNGSNRYASRTLTSGQTYYISVRYGSGTYRIAFNTSSTAPN